MNGGGFRASLVPFGIPKINVEGGNTMKMKKLLSILLALCLVLGLAAAADEGNLCKLTALAMAAL